MSKYGSCLNHCDACDSYYGYPEEFDIALNEGCAANDSYAAVIKCHCGNKRVAGGETCNSYDEPGIMMFGGKYDPKKERDHELPEFNAVMLTECSVDDPEKVASTYHSFGYCLQPGVTGRTIHLKPGVPKYIFRNLPCNCDIAPGSTIRWCISGSFRGIHGVIEWCTSYSDAYTILNKMRLKTDEPEKINITNYGEKCAYTDDFGEKRYYTRPALRHVECNISDKVLICLGEGYAFGQISNVEEDEFGKRSYCIFLWIHYDNEGYVHLIYQDLDDMIDSSMIMDVISRSKIKARPLNSFRSHMNKHKKSLYIPFLCRQIAQLPFYVPERYFKQDVYDMFRKQYPMRQDGSFNKKLFKRWLRQNISHIFVKKSKVVSN